MNLKLLALAGLALSACMPPAYYVSNVYKDSSDTDLVLQLCAIDAGKYGDKPDPAHCKLQRVGALPADVRAALGEPIPPNAPNAVH